MTHASSFRTSTLLLTGTLLVAGSSVSFLQACSGGDDFSGGDPAGTSGGSGGASAGGSSPGGGQGGALAGGQGGTSAAGGGSVGGSGGASPAGGGPAGGSGGAVGGQGGTTAGSGGTAGTSPGGHAGTSSGGTSAGGAPGCAPSTFHCDGDVLQGCDAASGTYLPIDTCGIGLCDETKGQCDGCHSGDVVKCANANAQAVCTSDDKNTKPVACPAAKPFCQGKGECVECTAPTQCQPSMKACLTATCDSGTCGLTAAKPGTVVPPPGGNPTHDCQQTVCDSSGGTMIAPDPTNLPLDDGSGCTTPTCTGSTPSQVAKDAGAACAAGGVCNGAGVCGVCIPGATRCVGNGEEVCGADGQWGAPTDCAAKAPVCSGTSCASVVSTAIGDYATCAVLSDGRVRCWGSNFQGVVGQPATVLKIPTPVQVDGLSSIVSVSVGGTHACALDSKGAVWCWGSNEVGQLGTGATTSLPNPTPQKVPGLQLGQVALGYQHSCGVTVAGDVVCWGSNESGQIGKGVAVGGVSPTPTPAGVANVIDLGAGASFTCALSTAAGLKCWGINDHGQLGSGTAAAKTNQPQTVSVTSGAVVYDTTKAKHLGVGRTHACAFFPGVIASCWGSGKSFEVGYGAGDSDFSKGLESYQLEKNNILSGTQDVDPQLGARYTCLPLDTGPVCMGADDVGQLGNGTTMASKNFLVPVMGLAAAPASLAAGPANGCAVQGGQAYCWGAGDLGQIGDGGFAGRQVATPVVW